VTLVPAIAPHGGQDVLLHNLVESSVAVDIANTYRKLRITQENIDGN